MISRSSKRFFAVEIDLSFFLNDGKKRMITVTQVMKKRMIENKSLSGNEIYPTSRKGAGNRMANSTDINTARFSFSIIE